MSNNPSLLPFLPVKNQTSYSQIIPAIPPGPCRGFASRERPTDWRHSRHYPRKTSLITFARIPPPLLKGPVLTLLRLIREGDIGFL